METPEDPYFPKSRLPTMFRALKTACPAEQDAFDEVEGDLTSKHDYTTRGQIS